MLSPAKSFKAMTWICGLPECRAVRAGLSEVIVDGAKWVAMENRIRELETALLGLYSECCHAGHNSDKDYAWPAVMDQAKAALTPQETEGK